MKTLIIGGGLSGLSLAEQLETQGEDYLLVEARARFGGRIETAHHAGAAYAHPRYGLPPELTGLWQDRLLFAGTAVAPGFGGYLEGALEAAENVLDRLTHQKTNPHHAE